MDIVGTLISIPIRILADALSPKVRAWLENVQANHRAKKVDRLRRHLRELTGPDEKRLCRPKEDVKRPIVEPEGGLLYVGMNRPDRDTEWKGWAFMLFNSETRFAIPAYHLEAYLKFTSVGGREIIADYAPWFHNHKDNRGGPYKPRVDIGSLDRAGVIIAVETESVSYTASYFDPAYAKAQVRLAPGEWVVDIRIEGHNFDARYRYKLTITALQPRWEAIVDDSPEQAIDLA